MTQQVEVVCTVQPAESNEKGVIAGLLQAYLKEQSAFTGARTAGDGRYRYPQLALYWKELERHPFLIRVGKRVAGFALVQSSAAGTQIADFYIAPEHRRQGHGRTAAHALFNTFPGKWAVPQLLDNPGAQTFWRRVIRTHDVGSSYGEQIETVRDKTYTIQRFSVQRR